MRKMKSEKRRVKMRTLELFTLHFSLYQLTINFKLYHHHLVSCFVQTSGLRVGGFQVDDRTDEVFDFNGVLNQMKNLFGVFISHRTFIDGACTN